MGDKCQKKFYISHDQKEFLEDYKKWGFSDQSTLVREALTQFMTAVRIRERKDLMTKKAQELLTVYAKDKELTAFTDLDGEDFL